MTERSDIHKYSIFNLQFRLVRVRVENGGADDLRSVNPPQVICNQPILGWELSKLFKLHQPWCQTSVGIKFTNIHP